MFRVRTCPCPFRVGLRRVYLVLALALIVSGCAGSLPRNTPLNGEAAERAVVPGIPGARIWGDEAPLGVGTSVATRFPVLKRLAASARIVNGTPQVYILALSGGGPDGAFGAGLLKGWSKSGKRPRFDVVTGVSAGSIIAPFAFLGSGSDYQLEEIWTSYGTDELITAQILPAIFGSPAFADTSKLRKLVEAHVTPRLLRAVAGEYAKGRLLLIGTTNLDAQRPVYWNMGEIAASRHARRLDLFRDIIMASAAIPGAFPPVSIEVDVDGRRVEEMHVDGGTTRDVFVAPLQLKLSALDHLYVRPPKRHIYIIMNSKTTPEFQPVKASAIAIGARAISTLIKAHDSGDLYRISEQARESGADFNVVSIPNSFAVERNGAFDTRYQRALFEVGEAMGQAGGGWRAKLPSPKGK